MDFLRIRDRPGKGQSGHDAQSCKIPFDEKCPLVASMVLELFPD